MPHDSQEPERALLLQLADWVQSDGWFPKADDYRTFENHELLDRMATGPRGYGLLDRRDGQYAWSGDGIRLMRGEPFFRQELDCAALLLEKMRERFDKKLRDLLPVEHWGDEVGLPRTDAQRAAYLLLREFPQAFQRSGETPGRHGLAMWVIPLEGIWRTSRQLLFDGPPKPKRPSLPKPQLEVDAVPTGETMSKVPDKKKVFVIHGRNTEARKQMGYFLAALGLDAINFDDVRARLKGTPTIADCVTAGMDQAQGVIALFTADEHAWTRPEFRSGESGEAVERWQARPNVLFEAGMAFGRDRDRVVFVTLGRVSLFTDVAGIHTLSPTNDAKGHRDLLRNVLKEMGCDVDLASSKWLHDGDFEAPVSRLPEVSPRDPFRH